VASIGGENPRPVGESSPQELRVPAGAGADVDAHEGPVRKPVTDEYHRIVIGVA
jgi:hypothetical protein